MKRTKMFRLIVLLGLVVAVIMPVSSVHAAEPGDIVDGLLDDVYTWQAYFPKSGSGDDLIAPGNLYGYETTDYCYWALVVDRAFNDNVFADNDNAYLEEDGWLEKGQGNQPSHEFGDLEQSDGAEFVITAPGGTYTMWLDYLNEDNANPGQYKSGQLGDGWNDGLASPVSAAATSLYYNMTQSGWTDETHSPPYDYNDTPGQYWEWHMIYEFAVLKSDIGEACGSVTQGGSHNSPYKDNDTLARLGDRVWYDGAGPNAGIQDAGEDGVAGVTVELYDCTDNKIRTTQTEPGTTGYYIFNNLQPGCYYVQFVAATLPPPPPGYTGYVFTDQDEGTDDTIDSDPDDVPTSPTYGQTAQTTLTAGETDLTWDAGIEPGQATAITLSSFGAKSSTGGSAHLVWLGLAGLMVLAAGSLFWAKRRAG